MSTRTHATLGLFLGLSLAASVTAQQRNHGMASAALLEKLFKYSCGGDASTAASTTFGRMFPDLPAGTASDAQLRQLAAAMRESGAPAGATLADGTVPAGMSFFGQFVDHDLTFDVMSQLGEVADPAQITNFRTPTLDLDSVYGHGPDASPTLYDRHRHGYLATGHAGFPDDLPRTAQSVALIGDPRNDENGLISQMHLLFLRFHNAVLADVERGVIADGRLPGESPFQFARRLVRWHYQWVVRHDFLPAVVDGTVLADVLNEIDHPAHPVCKSAPTMPVEFAVAAYRFGHSMVPGTMQIAPGRAGVDLFAPPVNALTSFSPVPPENVVDWAFFFPLNGSKPQAARRIDTFLADELFALPFAGPDANVLGLRNLRRGVTFALPSGEAAANALGGAPLALHPAVVSAGLTETPLWFYCLHEAEQNHGKLGKVGGTIVALTVLRALRADATSYMHAAAVPSGKRAVEAGASGWHPTLSSRRASRTAAATGQFTFADLAAYATR